MSNSLHPHGLQPTRLLCPWGFPRQEYWSGLPCPPPEDVPDLGLNQHLLYWQTGSLPPEYHYKCPYFADLCGRDALGVSNLYRSVCGPAKCSQTVTVLMLMCLLFTVFSLFHLHLSGPLNSSFSLPLLIFLFLISHGLETQQVNTYHNCV